MLYFRSHKMDAYRLYLLISGGTAFFFTLVFSVNMVYQIQTVGLSPLQLVLVGTTLELSVLLFEIPTGVVADVFSRRLSIIIGFALIGVGFMVEGLIQSFLGILFAQLLWGIGYTFTSGAQQAWITDEIGEERVSRAFMRASQVGSIMGILSTIVGIMLGSLLINLPIVLGGLLFIVLAFWLALYMPETGFKPTPRAERNTWAQMGDTLRAGTKLVRGSPTLLAIMGIGLFVGLYSEGVDRLSAKHLLESFTLPSFGGLQPVAWMGILGIVGGLLSTVATQLVIKRFDNARSPTLARASFLLNALIVGSVIGFALAGDFWLAVVFSTAHGIFRSLFGPLESAWINQHLASNVRATVISMRGMVDAVGQIGGGVPIGWIGNTFGVRAALVGSGLILSPALFLFARLIRRENTAQVEHPTGDITPAPETITLA